MTAAIFDREPGNSNGNSNNPNGNGGSATAAVVAAAAAAAASGLVGGGTSAAAAKNQLEQLNTMREALFSQDGWGCQHVNQDTNWDVPGSPEPPKGDRVGDSGGPPMWKPAINNGTDLWEANLRNGGQPPPQPVQKTPWGHTPSTNLGGTWGEDDDGSDTSNVWTGTPTNPAAPQWSQPAGSLWPPTAPGAVAVATAQQQKKESDWSGSIGTGATGAAGAGANAWGDPRDIRGGAQIDIRNADPRDLRPASDLRLIDPRSEAIRDMRGDPRGISGRLNGTSEMWGQHHTLTHGQISMNKMVAPVAAVAAVTAAAAGGGAGPGAVVGANNSQWAMSQPMGGGGPKDIAMSGGKPTGWEEPSPPAQRRNIPNYDDGTSLWGQQQRVAAGVSHWKDIDISRNHMIRGSLGTQGGAPLVGTNTSTPIPQAVGGGRHGNSGPNSQIKPETSMWSHAGQASRNNGSWGDDQHGVGGGGGTGSNWEEKSAAAAAAAAAAMGNIGGGGVGVNVGGVGWNDASASNAWKNQNKSQIWPDSDLSNEWGGPHGVGGGINKPPQSKLGGMSSELIRNSKQYRLLVDMGYKKEDVELTLRATNLNVDEAHELLSSRQSVTGGSLDSWRRSDDPPFVVGSGGGTGGAFDHSNAFAGRFPGTGPQPAMQFPPVQKYLNQGSHVSGAPNLSGGFGGGGQGGVGQGAGGAGSQGGVSAGGVGAGSHNSGQPSTQHLRMLVQQIQMAVQGGYLSGQILNQPLAPATLILLNQLLSNIKHLQGAQTSMQRNPMNSMQIPLAIAKYKQQIANLQNQINAQQTMYVKQQQQQAAAAAAATSHVGSANSEYLRGQHDAISALQSNFSEISLNKTGAFQGAPNPQSRLNQWKLPVLEKEATSDSTDFSRAPGPTVKSTLSTATNANNNIGTLGLQGDVSTWSSARNLTDGWPSDANNENENKDWPAAQPSPATAFTDLVPEFEPGKPWKGNQIKTIEDDPSITPGSVARSPLSINPTAKDVDLFANSSKTSPTDLPPLSLSSTTWSFNPSGNQPNFSGWSDNIPQSSATTSELWGTPMNKTSRGPPPGLGSNKSNVGLVGQGGGGVGLSGVSQGCGVSGNGSVVGSSAGVGGVSNPSVSSNGWIGSSVGGRVPNSATGGVPGGSGASGNANWSTANSNWHSTWLLLKNLTTQIDGSTLRTLCMQHGPLQNFHLYLNQGIALCKYSTREEANKAQMALNNCVLGNTTICAESPNESEVQNILQHLPAVGGGGQSQSGGSVGNNNAGGGGGSSGSGGSGGSSSGGVGGNVSGGGLGVPSAVNVSGGAGGQSSWRPQNQTIQSRPSDTWGGGSVWPSPNTTANLWTSPLDGATERGTPSNLKSFLPENLLELN